MIWQTLLSVEDGSSFNAACCRSSCVVHAMHPQVGKLQAKTFGHKQLRDRVGQAGRLQVPQAEPQRLKELSLVKRLVEQQEQLAAQREEIQSLRHAARRAPLRGTGPGESRLQM